MKCLTACVASAVLALMATGAQAQVFARRTLRGPVMVQPYGPQGALPARIAIRGGPPRPPAPIPHVASRTLPVPKAAPPRRGDAPAAAARPGPSEPAAQAPQQAAAVQPKPPEATAPSTVGQARPAPAILPTQDVPPVQALE